ncbi:zinc-ribbon domain-containing protein [Yersinia sp. LJYL362]|uniref:zinc-ribbon domain-containing protein n=1 Tax=Yersinia sp. LJYL362 TaxID=3402108 RepID=UPI003AB38C66
MLSKELGYTRKPDGGLAAQIEVLEAFADGDADNTELLMLLIELRSLRDQLAKQREPVVPPTIKISEVVAAVSPEQNRKWNGRVGYMAGWNACRDAMLFTTAKPITLGAEDVNHKVDITCYSCRRFITFQQHAEADGFCPYCNVEIELESNGG